MGVGELGVPAPNARRRAIRSSPRSQSLAVGYLLLSLTQTLGPFSGQNNSEQALVNASFPSQRPTP